MHIKSKHFLLKMKTAGQKLAQIFDHLSDIIRPGITTLEIDTWIAQQLKQEGMISCCKGYQGYKHVSCISVNDVIVHGVPSRDIVLQDGDLVTVDVCAAWKKACADMARPFFIGKSSREAQNLVAVAEQALHIGQNMLKPGNRISDVSHAIGQYIIEQKCGIVYEFAGHGIGRAMHEDPDVPNYGEPGKGLILRPGMTFAIEPMITQGSSKVRIDADGWTARTKDGSLAMHVENTVLVTENGPQVLTSVL